MTLSYRSIIESGDELTTWVMVGLFVENVHGVIVEHVVPRHPDFGHLADLDQIDAELFR